MVHESANCSKYIKFNNKEFEAQWKGKRIPMTTVYEAYFAGDIDFNGDMLEVLKKRNDFVSYKITWSLIHFVLTGFVPDVLFHSRAQDEAQVRDHYERGNDFFEWFLGPSMVYTSAYFTKDDAHNLEHGQSRKLNRMCTKLQVKPGMTLLDIGCGWGTLCRHATKHFGAVSTGVSLARTQVEWGNREAAKQGIDDSCKLEVMDYRDIPTTSKFDRITCIEMAEHVGVRKFQGFMRQIYNHMEDDGLFVMQVTGLRRTMRWEDINWGLFMNKYVFPGADASTPLGFYSDQLEKAGWEIISVENVTMHYGITIHLWYNNWMKNKDKVISQYGKVWFKTWEFFLAWSTIIARLGTAGCYQFLCNKNINKVNRWRIYVPDENDHCTLDNKWEPIHENAVDKSAKRPEQDPEWYAEAGAPIPKMWTVSEN
eukprot:TRINITY_DN21730_c0_g1_i1.p1 TRINITY_DN21730_c0_g1~~TRINITY_DN21730_c0_g1_i1.p1  ORF type:complete len:460 (+),score=78.57 TRINITY_DN21730_c0_g1_i1:106-1380(+)